ncbi:PEX11 domain protein [Aspergillus glaucus CBS 516.65]|uniref:Peroxisomal biogenesis factor 11 n=1 Tax=Aspergillus glaucus CBS 516.65 TaxID=1160497 RepID=A0A1L9VQM7_ASPGL|nr:hypothetical protein ASPGLDRAFT_45291 [Aspergillus glaucus CBS 516.65]OJJ86238.1 hypothetical protein ASPGLDRAFT_45291 [Aspergillus glaucus CBS 516.65]
MAQAKHASQPKQTQLQKQQKQPLLKQFTTFTKTTPGFERSLRLLQALSQIASDLSTHNVVTATRWATAKSQIALTRRYFRFLNFIDSFDRAYTLLVHGGDGDAGTVSTMLELGKSSALGIYVLLENLTILHAMGIYPQTPWARDIQTQAYKFWFWGLALSVLGGIWSLLFSSGTSAQSRKNEKVTPPSTTASKTLMKRVIVDGCDLMIPGSSLGWVSMGSEIVGMLMVLSTVVSMGDVWRRANGLG